MSARQKRTRIPSPQQVKVLKVFLEHKDKDSHGYDIMKATNLGPGTLYGLLKRLHDEGHLQKTTRIISGRCRIGYQLTHKGLHYAERCLIEHEYEEALKTNLEIQ